MWKSGEDGSSGNGSNSNRRNVTSFYSPSTDIGIDIIGSTSNSSDSNRNSNNRQVPYGTGGIGSHSSRGAGRGSNGGAAQHANQSQESYAVVGGFDTGSILEQYLNPPTPASASTASTTVNNASNAISPNTNAGAMALEALTSTSALSMGAVNEDKTFEAVAAPTEDTLPEQRLSYYTRPLVTSTDGLNLRESSSVSQSKDQVRSNVHAHVNVTEIETANNSGDGDTIHGAATVNKPMEQGDNSNKEDSDVDVDVDVDLYATVHDDTCALLSGMGIGTSEDETDDNGIDNQATPINANDIPQSWSSPSQKCRIEAYLHLQPDSESDNDSDSDNEGIESSDDHEEYDGLGHVHAPLLDDDGDSDCDCDFGQLDHAADDGHKSAWDDFLNGSFTNTFPLHEEGECIDLSQDDDHEHDGVVEESFIGLNHRDPFLAGDTFAASALQFSNLKDPIQPTLALGSNVNDSMTATAGSISTSYNNALAFESFVGDFDTSVQEGDHDHASLSFIDQEQSKHVDTNANLEVSGENVPGDSDSDWVSFSEAAAAESAAIASTMPTIEKDNRGHKSEDVAAAFHGSFDQTATCNVSEIEQQRNEKQEQEQRGNSLFAAFPQQHQESGNGSDPLISASFGEQPDNTDTNRSEDSVLPGSATSSKDLTTKSLISSSDGVGGLKFKSSFAAKMNAKLSQKQRFVPSQNEPSISLSKQVSSNEEAFLAPPVPDDVIYPSPPLSTTSTSKKAHTVTVPGIETVPSLQSPPLPRRRHHRNSTATSTTSTSTASAIIAANNKLLDLEQDDKHHKAAEADDIPADNTVPYAEHVHSAGRQQTSSISQMVATAQEGAPVRELKLQVPQMEDDASMPPQQERKGRNLPGPSPVRSRAKQRWQQQRQRANKNNNAPTSSTSSDTNNDISNSNPTTNSDTNVQNNNKQKNLQQSNESITPVNVYFGVEAGDNSVATASLLTSSSAQPAAAATAAATNTFTSISSDSPIRAVVDVTDTDDNSEAHQFGILFKKKTLGTTKAAIAAELTARKFEGLYGRNNSTRNRKATKVIGSSSAQNSPARKHVSASVMDDDEGGDLSEPLSSVTEQAIPLQVTAVESFGQDGTQDQEQEDATDISFSRVNFPQHLLPISHPTLMNISDNVERDKGGIRHWFHETVLRTRGTALRDCNLQLQPNFMTLDVVNSLISFVSAHLRIRLYIDNARCGGNDVYIGGLAKRTPPKMNTPNHPPFGNIEAVLFNHIAGSKAPPRTPRVPSAGGRRGPSSSQRSPNNNNTNKTAAYSPAGSRVSAATFASAYSHGTCNTTGAHSLQAEWGSPMPPSSANRNNDSIDSNIQFPHHAADIIDNATYAPAIAGGGDIPRDDLAVTRIDSMTSTSETTLLPHPMMSSSWNPMALVQSFLEWMVRISLHTRVPCPASVDALLLHVTSLPTASTGGGGASFSTSTRTEGGYDVYGVFQATLFASENEYVVPILAFFQDACRSSHNNNEAQNALDIRRGDIILTHQGSNVVDGIVLAQSGSFDRRPLSPERRNASFVQHQQKNKARNQNLLLEIACEQSNFILPKYFIPPPRTSGPSAAEMVLIYKQPQLLLHILSYIGCPAALCRFKQVKSAFRRYIHRHQQRFFKEMVRVGGMSNEMRPKFWIWMTLVKCREAEGCNDHDVFSGTGNSAGVDCNGAEDDDYYLEAPNAFVKCQSDAANSHNSDRVGAWQSRQYSYDPEHPDHHGWEGINGVPNSDRDALRHHDMDGGGEMPVAQWSHYNRSFTDSERGEQAITESASHGGAGAHQMMMMNGESAPAIGDDEVLMMAPGQHNPHPRDDFSLLEQIGREGKWQSVIARDVARAFGTLPPHKTEGNRKRDSVVLALAKLRRGSSHSKTPSSNGDGTTRSTSPAKSPSSGAADQSQDTSLRRILEHSRLSGISSRLDGDDNGSRNDYNGGEDDELSSTDSMTIPDSELVLSGVHAQGCKEEMQNQLSAILHALAATYDEVGYCQGMDYLVCHLMRIMVDEIMHQSQTGTLPPVLAKYNGVQYSGESHLVEETTFLVMDTIFSYYNLRHMYWPELRCLKRACKVFERLVERKLPVLADHFEHHELNVGIFALGWFQTLFLYLPNMPSATVCHMWDIWFVERNFKIFFRAATAILFLSQPTLLNQEYDGMMVYLNTFPDSTLLAPDILLECALNIKVTNRVLVEIEEELLREGLIH